MLLEATLYAIKKLNKGMINYYYDEYMVELANGFKMGGALNHECLDLLTINHPECLEHMPRAIEVLPAIYDVFDDKSDMTEFLIKYREAFSNIVEIYPREFYDARVLLTCIEEIVNDTVLLKNDSEKIIRILDRYSAEYGAKYLTMPIEELSKNIKDDIVEIMPLALCVFVRSNSFNEFIDKISIFDDSVASRMVAIIGGAAAIYYKELYE